MKFFSHIKYLPMYIVSLAPPSLLYFLSDIAYFILYHLVRYRRKVVLKNLCIAFPNLNVAQRKQIEQKFYHQFCDIMLETGKLLTISPESIKKKYKIKNPELVQDYFNKGRNIIMYGGHCGNWEWYSTIPLQLPHKIVSLYQELSNQYFDQLMQTIRTRFGMVCIESSKGYRAIMEYANQNILTLNLVIGDQRPGNKSPKHITTFFNRPTSFLVGADRIAKKTDQVVLFPRVTRKKRGYYELEYIVITEHAVNSEGHEIIDQFAKLLEDSIKASPELWLWSHNRWKHDLKNQSVKINQSEFQQVTAE